MCQRTNAALQKYLLAVKCNGVCVTLVTHACECKVCVCMWWGSIKDIKWSGSSMCPCLSPGPLAV